MRKLFAAFFAVFLAVATVPAPPAAAATTGVVRGTIRVNHQPHAGVAMTLRNGASLLQTATDNFGNYIFSQVPFGQYELVAHYPGVSNRTAQVMVQSDAVVTLNFDLTPLKVIGKTVVSAHAGVGGNPVAVNAIGRDQLQSLPTNNSLDRVIETLPGIVRFSYNEPVANGFHGITYEIDGAPMPQGTTSNFSEIIDPKDIDSIEVYTGDIPAEYGGSRMGAVVNIITDRLADLHEPAQGFLTGGTGNYGQALATLDEALKIGKGDLFLNLNSQRSDRGIDTPTYHPIHDNSSQADQFLRYITPLGTRSTLSLDFSNQLAQFQIPINTASNNPFDPQVSPPSTDDVQREYDRFANLNFTAVSKDGNGVFQLIPWARYTRVAYQGDLENDVLSTYAGSNNAGLRQDQRANYVGLRVSQFRASAHHAVKVGADFSREAYSSDQLIAAPGTPSPLPYTPVHTTAAQAGTQIGLYAEDKWQPSQALAVNYGLRFDHSTGFTSGWQLSPRIGVNIQADPRNVIHFYYGRMYAAPLLEDERGSCVVTLGCDVSNVPYDLKPERDAYFEMGAAHTFSPSISGYVNFFQRSAVNILDTTQLLNTPLFAVYNNGIGRDEGIEGRIKGKRQNGDSWFVSATVSHSEAGYISGGLFLFCPSGTTTLPDCANSVNGSGPFTAAGLSPEDHDQTYAAEGAYTHRFGLERSWFATLESNYGSGYPVNFQAGVARLPTHLTFDLSLGKNPGQGGGGPHSLGFDLDVTNLLNHQYIIKIANGFNTTQIASGRNVLFRVTAPF